MRYFSIMPIYEFYCDACHAVFSFLSRRVDSRTCPRCPACRGRLKREVSAFAAPRSRADGEAGDDGDFPLDEQRMETAMERMAGDLESIDENDPRQAARLMRKFSDLAGMRLKGGVEEAIARMEAGEDPEAVEADLGDALEEDSPFEPQNAKRPAGRARQRRGLRRDPKLYEMG